MSFLKKLFKKESKPYEQQLIDDDVEKISLLEERVKKLESEKTVTVPVETEASSTVKKTEPITQTVTYKKEDTVYKKL